MWLAALLAGCSGSSGPTAADPVGPPAPIVAPAPPVVPEGVDVVFVVLDTLRADALTQYGAARPTSPALGDFVRTATRFDAAYAPAPWTVPSTATILTGLHPLRHGMRRVGDVMPATIETLAVDVCTALAVATDCREERVFVRAQPDVTYDQFMEVMNTLQENGYFKVGLLNEDIE